ncbi:hypothetical protein OC713_02640 [Sweet potato little leaf phytoplasma]|uniref:hypothetical protein n=1 Tax=Candidatus Phytoplasma australasiaticum TaxID=2754999 RepID=UPI00271345D9|nr:hypothetical protein [Sweet potato little leaf phytoplasma]MDO7987401.1 hypothetical protein [Sweet potato little leaf phytoplasma]
MKTNGELTWHCFFIKKNIFEFLNINILKIIKYYYFFLSPSSFSSYSSTSPSSSTSSSSIPIVGCC